MIPTPVLLLALFTSGAVGLYYVNRRNQSSMMWAITRGHDSFQAGRYDEALEILEAALSHTRRDPAHRAMVLYMIGMTRRARGDLDVAVATLKDAVANGHPVHAARIHAELAQVYAWRGDLELARPTLEKARAMANYERVAEVGLVADAIITLRSGDPVRAAQLLKEAEPKLERVVSVAQMKTVYLLQAFALASDGQTREGGAVVQAIARSRGIENPARLTTAWPELKTFVETALR
jgi:tetratricopeptide (TPR) repeat protein